PFFFSSRRRHPRFSRDWSSDVCSSDLGEQHLYLLDVDGSVPQPITKGPINVVGYDAAAGTIATAISQVDRTSDVYVVRGGDREQIGRASCRERGEKTGPRGA